MKKGKILMKICVTVEDTFGEFNNELQGKRISDKTLSTSKQLFAVIHDLHNISQTS